MRKHNVTTTGNSREQETKWKTKNEQMRKSHIYFSQQSAFCEQDLLDNDDNGFGILMLGLYDLQVRRVLRYDQNDQDERRCKKIKDAKGEHGDLGYPRIIPQQQNSLGSSAIVKVSEQTGAAPKPIPPRFPGSK